MYIPLSTLLAKSKESGATDESAAVDFNAFVKPNWLAWITSKLGGTMEGSITAGKIEDGKFVYKTNSK